MNPLWRYHGSFCDIIKCSPLSVPDHCFSTVHHDEVHQSQCCQVLQPPAHTQGIRIEHPCIYTAPLHHSSITVCGYVRTCIHKPSHYVTTLIIIMHHIRVIHAVRTGKKLCKHPQTCQLCSQLPAWFMCKTQLCLATQSVYSDLL